MLFKFSYRIVQVPNAVNGKHAPVTSSTSSNQVATSSVFNTLVTYEDFIALFSTINDIVTCKSQIEK